MEDLTYKRYTDLYTKENNLIKNRVSWLFGTQTLLFGILKFPEIYREFQITIVHVGFWSSIMYFISVLAAVITYLKFHFIRPRIEELEKINFPEFNRSTVVLIFGFLAALGMPLVFVIAWYYQFQYVN